MPSVLAKLPKDPDAILPYTIDWRQWLETGDSISTVVWTITPVENPLVLLVGNGANGAPAPTNTATAATIWLIGGTLGLTYLVACKITTSPAPPKTDERTIALEILQR